MDGDKIRDALGRFGHDALRPGQAEAVGAVLDGRDVVVLAPTGGGKSLCYQLPAVLLAAEGAGATIVVSPLVALMDDQVRQLSARGIRAAAIHRDVPYRDRDRVLRQLDAHDLVYVSPERLKSVRFQRALQRGPIARIAIDEAHCISEWGHDFRPDYGRLAALKDLVGRPTVALTATATPRVLGEIAASLRLDDPLVLRSPIWRDNLSLTVEHHRGDKARTDRLIALLAEAGLGKRSDRSAGRVVVYAATRARTVSVARALRAAKFAVAHYHAGRTTGAREKAQDSFAEGHNPVMVATTAFGMGIDHPDVRLVVHVQAPGTLEAYAQQAGRAGRDGAPARCVLLYAPGDARTQARLRGETPHPGTVAGWRALQDLTFGKTCRMAAIAAHFGEDAPDDCGRCDVCLDGAAVAAEVERARSEDRARRTAREAKAARDRAVVLDEAQRRQIVAFVDGLKKPVGKRVVAAGLRGGRAKRIVRLGLPNNPAFGTLKGIPEVAIVAAIEEMLAAGDLAARGKKYPTVWMPEKRVRPIRPAGSGGASKKAKDAPSSLKAALKALRKREARRRRWKPYQVFPDVTLEAIVETRPTSAEALLAVPGMGPTRFAKFGGPILEIVGKHATSSSDPRTPTT